MKFITPLRLAVILRLSLLEKGRGYQKATQKAGNAHLRTFHTQGQDRRHLYGLSHS